MKFRFSVDTDGEIDGNDASQEHFAGNRLSSVARELGQNTNDARSKEAIENDLPAVISFKKISLSTNDIPDISGLKEKLKGCKEFAEKNLKNSELTKFYENAIKIASKPKINVLQITDWNTTGLEGPYNTSSFTPITAFAKGKGVSDKGTNTAGGSRGIGKNAIFTISSLRTIFFSTYSIDRSNKNLTHYAQGKSVLISDIDNNGSIRRGKGYCGLDGALAKEGIKDLPTWLIRDSHIPHASTKGLSLFALGFEQENNWNIDLSIAALTTFFSAISQGLIEFHIENKNHSITLNKNNYINYFKDDDFLDYLQSNQEIFFNHAKIYAEILEESNKETPTVHVREFESEVGKFKLCISVDEGLHSKVAIIRTGMMITDRVQGLIRFSGKDFAATLEAQSETSIEFIRSLEGAEHNALQPDRIDDPKERKKAHRRLASITKRAREIINSYIKIETDDNVEINELAEFFPFQSNDVENDPEKGELNPLGKIKLAVKKPPKVTPTKNTTNSKNNSGDNSGNGEDSRSDSGNGNLKKDGSGNTHTGGDGSNSTYYLNTTDVSNIRAPYKKATPNSRIISFLPIINGTLQLNINVAGGDEDVPLIIKRVSDGELSSNKVILNKIEADKRISIKVEFDRDFQGAISLTALKPITEVK